MIRLVIVYGIIFGIICALPIFAHSIIAASDCLRRELVKIHTGFLVPDQVIFSDRYGFPTGSKIYKLGEGEWAHVYRVEPPRGDSFVFKMFKEADQSAVEREVEGFAFLNGVCLEVKSVEVGVAKVKRSTERWIELSDTKGRPLDQLLNDPAVGAVTKQKLRTQFASLKKDMVEVIKRKHRLFFDNFKDEGPDELLHQILFEVIRADGKRHNISIKPANIIVDVDTGKFTIIDPL